MSRLRAALVAATLACGAGSALPAPAAAAALSCGDVVTHSVTLDADVGPCPGRAALVVGARDITIDLSGHTVALAGESSGYAVDDTRGYDHVTIRDGRLVTEGAPLGHGRGVGLTDARRVRLLDLDITAGFGVEAAGSPRLVIRDSTLDGFFRGVTLDARSGRALIADSTVRGESTAMTIASNHNRVALNTILGAGVTLTVGGDDNVVARNDLSGGVPVGVDVRGRGNVLTRNILHDGSGMTVGEDALNTLLARNAVTHTIGDGIRVENPSTVVRRNIATGNARLGIFAVAGTIDGGGNRASGNGDARQCLNVACSS